MFVILYLVALSYFGIAAVSPVVTTVPDTWVEFERLAILFGLASGAYYWGGIVAEAQMREFIHRVMHLTSKER
jgi:hypothetical protein